MPFLTRTYRALKTAFTRDQVSVQAKSSERAKIFSSVTYHVEDSKSIELNDTIFQPFYSMIQTSCVYYDQKPKLESSSNSDVEVQSYTATNSYDNDIKKLDCGVIDTYVSGESIQDKKSEDSFYTTCEDYGTVCNAEDCLLKNDSQSFSTFNHSHNGYHDGSLTNLISFNQALLEYLNSVPSV